MSQDRTGAGWRSTTSLLALLASGFAGHAASAQTTGAQAGQNPVPSRKPGRLEEITVTAERRSASAQKSAIAITALGAAQVAQQGITDTVSLIDHVPGLDLTQSTTYHNVIIRGLGSGGSTQFADPAVSETVAGIPLGRSYATNGPIYDLARIEVLKGPQGTLYGRNATVGALNLVPNRPTQTLGAEASLTVGDYGTVNSTADVNVPINDKLAARLAFASNDHNGYLSNGFDDANNQAGRASLLYRPDSALTVYAFVDFFNDDSKGSSTIFRYPVPGQEYQFPSNPWFAYGGAGCGNPAICPTLAQSGGPKFNPAFAGRSAVDPNGYNKLDQTIVGTQIDYNLGWATATLLPGYVDTQLHSLSSPQGLTDFFVRDHVDQYSIEGRLASNSAQPLRWLIGAFYYNEHQDADQQTLEINGFNNVNTPDLKDSSEAVFGEATYSILRRLRLTGGLRYTAEDKSQNGSTLLDGVYTATTCPAAQGGALVGAGSTVGGNYYPVGGCIVPNSGSLHDSNVSWKVGLEFDVTADSLVYGNIRTGFRSGGLVPGLPPNTYRPETLTAYEIGSKNSLFDHRLRANAELFYYDYKDQQLNVLQQLHPAGQTSFPVNVPGYAEGVEVNLSWLITPSDTLTLDQLYEDGEYNLFPTAVASNGTLGGLVDYPRINLPRWNGTVSYEHRLDLANGAELLFDGDMHFESGASLRAVPDNLLVAGDHRAAFARGNLELTYVFPAGNWRVMGFVHNVSNVAVIETGTGGGIGPGVFFRPTTNPALSRYAGIDPPRTYGVTVSTKF